MSKAVQLISNTVLLSEQKSLTANERKSLISIRNKKGLYIGSTYLLLSGLLIFAWVNGPYSGGRRSKHQITQEDIDRYNVVAPIVISFLLLLLTIYFFNYYRKTLHTYIKDIKGNIKVLYYFEPESYKTPFFDTYYIKTISRKRPMVRITKELYDAIQPGCKACISMSPFARFVFTIEVEDKKMEFNEKNSILDL